MKDKPLVPFIVGPTATGKTELGIKLAKKFNGEIISADSMQVYKYMDIGTAKPTIEEREGIVHHLMDVVNPDEDFSVALFQKMALEAINCIHLRGKLPIVVGGTGLYINSLVFPLDFSQGEINNNYRNKLYELEEKYGKGYIHKLLKHRDPVSYYKLFPNDTKRIVRALEVYKDTKKPISLIQKQSKKKEIKIKPLKYGLTMDREILYDKINKRIDLMLEKGLIKEVKKLISLGYKDNLIALEGLGYKEIIKYLNGEYSYNEAVEILKRDTRRFAKRQMTWFRKDPQIKWFDVGKIGTDEILKIISNDIEEGESFKK